jgi:signal transduction histidine kinase
MKVEIMMVEITCPQCNRYVMIRTLYCEHCGADLSATVEINEPTDLLSSQESNGGPISPEILVPRVGEYMIEQGLLDQDGLKRALAYQKECSIRGESILLGQALLALNLVTREDLDKIITMQILKLQYALREANINLQQRVDERTQDLLQAMERLAELNHLKSNFISNISHELRTPLTHIKGYVDILAEGGLGQLNDKQQEVVEVLVRAEERLENLIEDLLQFSLASKGELTITPNPVHIDQLVGQTLDRVYKKITDKAIKLHVDVPSSLPPVTADREKIGWVLLQLIDNAVKFTPAGGLVKVHAIPNGGIVNIAVMDTGIGIPPERMDEIFEPFHQLDSSTTRRYSGTGLGLAMARRIIEAHGSRIKVESVVNKGSKFQFNLPIANNNNNAFTTPPTYYE